MGFLNHATNNIIIDAVLTERGRELLANESFNITSFAFGDDEVDYSIIQKYGVTIGKEKIQKNTPVFEASTNENTAIKNYLITYQNPVSNLSNMPKLKWENAIEGISNLSLQFSDTTSTVSSSTVTVVNYVKSLEATDSLDSALTDTFFYIKVHGDLLTINSSSDFPVTFIDSDSNNVATYRVRTSQKANGQWSNQRVASFVVSSYGIVNNSSFTKFGSVLNTNKINTNIQIIGMQSGATTIIPVTITKN